MFNFLLTIDTEEEGLWGGNYRRHPDCTVENARYLTPFQEFCNKRNLHPTYLIDYPFAINPNAINILQNILKTHQCEIGAHLHPWSNPPYEEKINIKNSYLNNLPVELQYKKLKVLTDAIQENLDVKPVSFRAGRYGFDTETIPILEELEYKVDSSIVPFRNTGRPHEPVFNSVSLNPYNLDYRDVCKKGDSRIVEVPISVGFTSKIPESFKKAYVNLPNIGARKILRSFFNLDMVWLRPSYSNSEEMKRLVDTLAKENVKILNMMFHSTELMPGASPYNKTQKDVDIFLDKIDTVINHIRYYYSVKFITLKNIIDFVV